MATPFQHYTIHYQSGSVIEAQVQLFNAGIFIGNLNFHTDNAVLPANTQTVAGIFSINYHLSRFRDVLQILQYEKPLQINLRAGIGDLMATGFEPVGEQEGV